ncbi:MAG TPA: SRPBCC family protein [Methylocystis sp.]|jgi:uncharacterized protein YndB with AHSA1/START domain
MTLFLLVVLALISGLIAYISLQPNTFKITRSAIIDAPPETIYPLINDLHSWEAWSPWARLDPNAKNSFDGSPLGPGASMSWSGNNKVGAGKMTIKESSQNERIRLKLEFSRPMQAASDVQFDLAPVGETRTEVAWAMSGRNEFMGKAMAVFMNMDKVVGAQFELGLANLKAVAEAEPKALPGA